MMKPDQKTDHILDAALPVFVRFGFAKTSMSDIARAAKISRASLYLTFSSKEELFRAGSARAHARTLDEVATMLAGEGSALDRVERAVAIFQRELIAPFGGSDDANELFAANAALASDITDQARIKLLDMLAQALVAASEVNEIDLASLQAPPSQLANLILAGMEGIKHSRKVGPDLEDETKLFMRLLRIAVTPGRGG